MIGSDEKLVSELGGNEKFLVQVLDPDEARVKAARAIIRKSGHYGRVTAHLFDGRSLPYAENLVAPPLSRSDR